ncbi:MAG: peptidoglycan editing factor PgeF [Firmicutes bacterium]|nr:peptidoglycan editing factor PgeF [Bacillota bacterium]
MYELKQTKDLTYLAPPGWRGVLCAFTTRRGGVSKGPFAGLNLGRSCGDDRSAVDQNWQLVLGSLELEGLPRVAAWQVHGVRVERVTDPPGDYHLCRDTDALITDRRGIALSTLYADCVPLVFYDPHSRAIGMAHAGWRGTRARIGPAALAAMGEAFGTRPGDCLVGIGPSIGPCCYSVGPEVAKEFAPLDAVQSREGKLYVDLPRANRFLLLHEGIPPENIQLGGICTSCRQDLFFSHRGSGGLTGRMASIMVLL